MVLSCIEYEILLSGLRSFCRMMLAFVSGQMTNTN